MSIAAIVPSDADPVANEPSVGLSTSLPRSGRMNTEEVIFDFAGPTIWTNQRVVRTYVINDEQIRRARYFYGHIIVKKIELTFTQHQMVDPRGSYGPLPNGRIRFGAVASLLPAIDNDAQISRLPHFTTLVLGQMQPVTMLASFLPPGMDLDLAQRSIYAGHPAIILCNQGYEATGGVAPVEGQPAVEDPAPHHEEDYETGSQITVESVSTQDANVVNHKLGSIQVSLVCECMGRGTNFEYSF
jgi:hypothetical protein